MEEKSEVKEASGQTLSEALNSELDVLKSEYPEISSAAIISSDGLLMAVRPAGAADDKVAAMSAFLLNSANRSASSLGWSGLGYVMVNHPDGYLLVADAGKATITLSTSPMVKLGLLLYDLKASAKRLKERLDGD
jgi:predicted regulator of Ras-like GTPase activity (Roadblock/LC7/MglB family)